MTEIYHGAFTGKIYPTGPVFWTPDFDLACTYCDDEDNVFVEEVDLSDAAVLDANGAQYDELVGLPAEDTGGIAEWAKENGHSWVIIENVSDCGPCGGGGSFLSDVVIQIRAS